MPYHQFFLLSIIDFMSLYISVLLSKIVLETTITQALDRNKYDVYYARDLQVLCTWFFYPRGGVMSMGDECDQSTKLKQAIDILSSICSGGTTSVDTSGESSASRSDSQRRPDHSHDRGAGT